MNKISYIMAALNKLIMLNTMFHMLINIYFKERREREKEKENVIVVCV